MNFYLKDFVPIRPRFEIAQKKLLEWTANIHAVASEKAQLATCFTSVRDKLFQLGTGSEKIQSRGVHIGDPLHDNYEDMQIYPVTRYPQGASFKDRMLFFDTEVSEIFEQFYTSSDSFPGHIIHVTCTGYVAPSPAQKTVSKRNAKHVCVTHAYHMGCYASIPAIRIAAGSLLLSPESPVDIVHTELCSLHFHPLRSTIDQLIVHSLFADGFIKYSLSKEESKSGSLKVLSLLEEIIPDSLDSMTWRCEDICHSMTLSKKVPVFITRSLQNYFSQLVKKAGLDEIAIKKQAFFAIHPGGPKILQHIQQLFELEDGQIAHSLSILQTCGNMSSATLPHIWEKLVNDDHVPKGAFIVSLAFGPGLNISGALFQKT